MFENLCEYCRYNFRGDWFLHTFGNPSSFISIGSYCKSIVSQNDILSTHLVVSVKL